jgi:hypothetical protein
MVAMPSPRFGSSAGEAAEALRRLLKAVDVGEIEADTPQARRLLRRLEGAVGAWGEDEPVNH